MRSLSAQKWDLLLKSLTKVTINRVFVHAISRKMAAEINRRRKGGVYGKDSMVSPDVQMQNVEQYTIRISLGFLW